MGSMFWTWMHLTGDTLDESTPGLIAEARRLADQAGGGPVTVVAIGVDPGGVLAQLGGYGADQVIHLNGPHLAVYQGELFAAAMAALIEERRPTAVLFAHGAHTADLAGRLGAQLASAVITRAVDARLDQDKTIEAVRPIANGYLFETVAVRCSGTVLVTFLPTVLADPHPGPSVQVPIEKIDAQPDRAALQIRSVGVIEADPQTLAIEEADIVVAGGRGVGQGAAFEIIHRLAQALGGSVAGTRPVIDWHTLPFERQIGQTGKSVSPRLILNCGISGANEYTAGIEKSQLVIAINSDARARIFRFADLGVVGDLHAVLPLLVERLEQTAKQGDA